MKEKVWDWLKEDDHTGSLFDGVPRELLDCVKAGMVQTFHDGDEIISEGSAPKSFVILLSGEANIRLDDVNIATRVAPALIGEQAFVENSEHSATVIASRYVRALVLPHELVDKLLRDPSFSLNVMRQLSWKLRQSTKDRGNRYGNEERLFREFKAHISATALNCLMQNGENYGAPRSVDAIILFSDIREFTKTTGQMAPENIAAELGPYFGEIVDVIHAHGGLVDKFIGDAVMAVWGYAPEVEGALDAGKVFRCAQAMIETASRCTLGGQPVSIGVGINAGKVFSGNIGSEGKRQWTVLGEPVNLASRFESASKTLGASVVLGQSVRDLLSPDDQQRLEAHPNQQIKGAENQTLYTFSRPGA